MSPYVNTEEVGGMQMNLINGKKIVMLKSVHLRRHDSGNLICPTL